MIRAALIAVLAAAVFASAAQAETLTFSVMSVAVSGTRTDRPPKGTSAGDTIVLRDRLINTARRFGRPKGAVVGSDHGTLTYTGPHTARFSGTVVLPDGTLQLAGAVTPLASGGLEFKVAGGTGRYAKARGKLIAGPGDKRSLNTYHLTFSSGNVA